jgi:hypothetical protein
MESTIWKYELSVTGLQEISIPVGSRFLSVDRQDGRICLWVMVDPKNVNEKRLIEIIGTGNPVPWRVGMSRRHIGTVIMDSFVWHVFERIEGAFPSVSSVA